MRADQRRKQQQQQKAQAREAALEPRNLRRRQSLEGGGGQLSFMDRIMNFLVNTLLGFLAVGQLILFLN